MTLSSDVAARLLAFHRNSDFARKGGIITDLDGTALHEEDGRIFVALPVEEGLKALVEQHRRPVVLNTLRFPLNVVRTFGRAWSAITHEPIPLVSLNGAVLGLLTPVGDHDIEFIETISFSLDAQEVDDVAAELDALLTAGMTDLVVFHYPCDWRIGEIIWTPNLDRVEALGVKFGSASDVTAGSLDQFVMSLRKLGACMLSILADIPQDKLMAYQHANPNRFVTAAGIDKLSGAREAAAHLGFELVHSIGAGDTPMDSFLSGVGLALHVGELDVPYAGRLDTIRLTNPAQLGDLLFALNRLLGDGGALGQ